MNFIYMDFYLAYLNQIRSFRWVWIAFVYLNFIQPVYLICQFRFYEVWLFVNLDFIDLIHNLIWLLLVVNSFSSFWNWRWPVEKKTHSGLIQT